MRQLLIRDVPPKHPPDKQISVGTLDSSGVRFKALVFIYLHWCPVVILSYRGQPSARTVSPSPLPSKIKKKKEPKCDEDEAVEGGRRSPTPHTTHTS
eukprot:scaffold5494_cov128-Skeletonema_dohrnii-CCMP3373.AAC.12